MLWNCVDIDEAGKDINAAFAIGRLCDLDDGRKRLLHHKVAKTAVRNVQVLASM